MASEHELHLINQNQALKKRIREMEELFASQDDEYHEELKKMMAEQKKLTEKNNALEARIFHLDEEKAELSEMVEKLSTKVANVAPQKSLPVPAASDSFLNDYASLQDTVDDLNENKIKLEAKVQELEAEIKNLVDIIDSLEIKCQEQDDLLLSVNKTNKQLLKENREYLEEINGLQAQLDMISIPEVTLRGNCGTSLFQEVEAERQKILKEKADLEQEVQVLRKTLASHGEGGRQEKKDFECLRETMKNLSQKNKELQREVERKKDVEAEFTATKQNMKSVEKENDMLRNENDRLKKQYVSAESRADENAHLLSKVTNKIAKREDWSFDVRTNVANNYPVHVFRSPVKSSLAKKSKADYSNEMYVAQSFDHSSLLRAQTTSSNPSLLQSPSPQKSIKNSRKRGIMLDYSEPVNQKKLNLKLATLTENNRQRQLGHLKSHYDPSTGTYDESYGESPEAAAKLQSSKKENNILNSILRK
jgi:chromosome segregation ATPase